MMEPVPAVIANYTAIANALANDSLREVPQHASSIAEAIRRDRRKMLSPEMSAEADSLAQVHDLLRARVVFRRLSKSLTTYLTDHEVADRYDRFYCPITKSTWLQTKRSQIANPYLGSARRRCGKVVEISRSN